MEAHAHQPSLRYTHLLCDAPGLVLLVDVPPFYYHSSTGSVGTVRRKAWQMARLLARLTLRWTAVTDSDYGQPSLFIAGVRKGDMCPGMVYLQARCGSRVNEFSKCPRTASGRSEKVNELNETALHGFSRCTTCRCHCDHWTVMISGSCQTDCQQAARLTARLHARLPD